MATGSNSGVAVTQTDLSTIREDGFTREQSASPEPYDCASPDSYGPSTDTADFEPASQGVNSINAPSQVPMGSNVPYASNGVQSSDHVSTPTVASNVLLSKLSRTSSPRSKNKKRNSQDSDDRAKQPKRNSTNITNASASLEDTAVWDHKAILSLDGGGIRGYSALLIIRQLMRVIGKLESEHSEPAESSFHPLSPAPNIATDNASIGSNTLCDKVKTDSSPWLPCHYFDYVAGTSTGGLISIMLGRLRMSIDDCIHDYEQFGDRVFGHARWFHVRSPLFWIRPKYNHKTLEKVVKEVVETRVPHVASFPGGRNFAFDENRCRTVVLSYQKQKIKGVEKTYLFRTYKNLHRGSDHNERLLDRNPGLAHDVPIWKVARATSAAPTYFQKTKINDIEYLDGGFGSNNPCIEIYDEVRKMNNNSEDFASIIISIGTGKKNTTGRFSDGIGLSQYFNYLNFAKKWATDAEATHMDMMKMKKKGDIKFPYFRFNVEDGLDVIKLDEWRVRGPVRTTLGKGIGAMRFSGNKDPALQPVLEGNHGDDQKFAEKNDKDISTPQSSLPKWLQPKNKTLESISKHTEAYLAIAEVKEWIQKCAQLLVDNRRLRAQKDPQRWEKACFGAWYQCNIEKCRRAEKEYETCKALELHLLDKHREQYDRLPQNQEKLMKALADCKVVVH